MKGSEEASGSVRVLCRWIRAVPIMYDVKRRGEKDEGKNERKEGFSGLLTSFCSVLNSKPTAPNAPSMPAEQCPALCFKISAQKT